MVLQSQRGGGGKGMTNVDKVKAINKVKAVDKVKAIDKVKVMDDVKETCSAVFIFCFPTTYSIYASI